MTSATFAPETDAHADGQLGARVRERRLAMQLSLKDVAARSGLSIGLLSQIERGISSPTVRSLRLIGEALGIAPSSLFDSPAGTGAASPIVTRRQHRHSIDFAQGVTKQLLTAEGAEGVELLLVTMEPGASSGEEFYTHPGHEAGHVLSGTVTLYVQSERFVLNEGDSFKFRSTVPHRFDNAGPTQAQVIWALAAPLYL